MASGRQAKLVLDLDDDLADGGTGHAVFLGNLSLRFGLAIDNGEITFRLHRRLPVVRVLQGLQQPDRRLVSEGAGGMTAAFLLLVVLPELAEDFQAPPVEQRDLRG